MRDNELGELMKEFALKGIKIFPGNTKLSYLVDRGNTKPWYLVIRGNTKLSYLVDLQYIK